MRISLSGYCRALCLLACSLQLPWLSAALYEDQAGLYDWHIPLIGVPKQSLFHRSDTRSRQLLLLTERGILASIQPRSGAIIWRHDLNQGTGTAMANHTFYAFEEYVATLSTSKNKVVVRVWNVKSSFLVWDYTRVLDAVSTQRPADITLLSEGDIVLVVECNQLVRFSIKDGQIVWQNQLAISDNHCYQDISTTTDKHKQLRVHSQLDNGVLDIIEVDQQSGKKVTNGASIRPKTKQSIAWIQAMDTRQTYAVWAEQTDKRQWVVYAQSTSDDEAISLSIEFEQQVKVHVHSLSEHSQAIWLLARTLTSEQQQYYSYLITIEKGRLVKTIKFFSQMPSVFGHVHTDNAKHSLVARLSSDIDNNEVTLIVHDLTKPSQVAFTAKVAFSLVNSGPIINAIIEAAIDKEGKIEAVRALTTTADESIHLLRDTNHVWTREESLSNIVAMESIDLPESNLVSLEHDELDEPIDLTEQITSLQRFTRRVITHSNKMIHYLRSIISWHNNESESDNSSSSTMEGNQTSTTTLRKDTFGLRKLLVFVTRSGKVIAMDSANQGNTIWSRFYGVRELDEKPIKIHAMFNVRSTIVKYPPLLAVVATKYDNDELPETRVLCLDALNGQNYTATGLPSETVYPALEPQKVYHLPLESSHSEHANLLALMDEQQQQQERVHLWPSNEDSRVQLMSHASQWVFTKGLQIGASQLSGYQLAANQDQKSLITRETWRLALPDDLHIVATTKHPVYDPTASIGRTLGNRSVLFKYLNPNIIGVAAVNKNEDSSERLYIYLLDSVSGTVLYHTVYAGVLVDSLHPVHMVLSENWVTITFAGQGDAHLGTAKGYQVVSLELYENATEDTRVESEVFSSFDPHRPYVMSQAFALPYGVNAAGITITRLGITTKKLLMGLPSGQLFGISRRLVDARRTTEPTSDADKEDGLLPYEPAIPFNPSWVLSYNQTIWGMQHIASIPSMMESTSLIVAYGLDIYFTRDTPSGTFDMLNEDFSKSALLLTIVGLTIGIAVANPMVRRKKLNARWK